MTDNFVLVFDADVVFVAVVSLTILLSLPCLNVFLAQLRRIAFPIFGRFTFFDLGVLFPAVALPRGGNQAGINNLSFTGPVTHRPNLLVQFGKKLINQIFFLKGFTK